MALSRVLLLLALAATFLELGSNAGARAATDGVVSARLLLHGQEQMLNSGRVAVRVSGQRRARVRLSVVAVETIPARMRGPRRHLTRGQVMVVPPKRPVTVRLKLTAPGRVATTTCARYELNLWVRSGHDRVGRLIPLGPTRLDSSRCQRFFALDGPWNRRLEPDDPVDPTSAVLVAKLKQQVDNAVAKRFWPTINISQYSTTVYEVPSNQPHVRVTLDDPARYRDSLREAFRSVPVPSDAKPANGTDHHMVVWEPSTDTMWEFWLMKRLGDGWHARMGGKMTHVSRNPGYFDRPAGSPWGATATSLPLLGGLIFPQELAKGRVDHALALALPTTRRAWWSWPAQRQDGYSADPQAIPQGTRFRIAPNVDIEALGLPPAMRAIAYAIQRYGMIVRDTAGTPVLYAEDPTPTGTNPYPALFDHQSIGRLLAKLPWGQMQAMRLQLRTYAQ